MANNAELNERNLSVPISAVEYCRLRNRRSDAYRRFVLLNVEGGDWSQGTYADVYSAVVPLQASQSTFATRLLMAHAYTNVFVWRYFWLLH
jgi:hypothetical protein